MKKLLVSLFLILISVENVFSIERKLKSSSDQVLSDPIGASNFFQMFFGLFLIIVLIIGLAWLVRRVNNFQGSLNGVLKVVSMISVGQKEKVALIQVGKQQILIGVAVGKVNTLLVLDEVLEKDNISNSLNTKNNFAEKLSSVLKGKLGQS